MTDIMNALKSLNKAEEKDDIAKLPLPKIVCVSGI